MKNTTSKRVAAALAAACLWLCFAATASAQQPPPQGATTRYVYDGNGRLRAVVTANGEAVVYTYDAAGNVLSVRRLDADDLEVFAFAPQEGSAGDLVEIIGSGFGQGITSVTFNGVAARVVEVSGARLVAEVPEGAATGPITITTPGGTATTADPFVISARVRIIPAPARILPNDRLQFTALVTSFEADRSVIWSVNGITGGSAADGTISENGLYTAPAKQTGAIVVRATAAADPELFGESEVTLRVNVQVPSSPLVSVSRTAVPNSRPFSAPVSVRRGDPLGLNTPRADGVSVKYGSATPADRAFAPLVSVRRGSITGAVVETTAPVSVRNGGDPGRDRTTSPFVTVNTGPHLASLAPLTIARGQTVTLTVTGANLEGASALRIINTSGNLDTTITVTNLSVSADGTTLTATLVVSTSVATGRRIISVTTPTGVTTREDVSVNVIEITP